MKNWIWNCWWFLVVGLAWIVPGRIHRWAKAMLHRRKEFLAFRASKEFKEAMEFLDTFIETEGAILKQGGSA